MPASSCLDLLGRRAQVAALEVRGDERGALLADAADLARSARHVDARDRAERAPGCRRSSRPRGRRARATCERWSSEARTRTSSLRSRSVNWVAASPWTAFRTSSEAPAGSRCIGREPVAIERDLHLGVAGARGGLDVGHAAHAGEPLRHGVRHGAQRVEVVGVDLDLDRVLELEQRRPLELVGEPGRVEHGLAYERGHGLLALAVGGVLHDHGQLAAVGLERRARERGEVASGPRSCRRTRRAGPCAPTSARRASGGVGDGERRALGQADVERELALRRATGTGSRGRRSPTSTDAANAPPAMVRTRFGCASAQRATRGYALMNAASPRSNGRSRLSVTGRTPRPNAAAPRVTSRGTKRSQPSRRAALPGRAAETPAAPGRPPPRPRPPRHPGPRGWSGRARRRR